MRNGKFLTRMTLCVKKNESGMSCGCEINHIIMMLFIIYICNTTIVLGQLTKALLMKYIDSWYDHSQNDYYY